MEQTAVKFLHSEYKRIFSDVLIDAQKAFEISDALEQAKEMEKQQIIDTWNNADENYYCDYDGTVEKYLYEFFKNK